MVKVMLIKEQEYICLLDKLEYLIEVVETKKQSQIIETLWLTQEEVKKVLCVSNRTLQNYRDNGILSFSKVGRKIKYKQIDVESLLQKHYVKGFTE